MKNIAYFLTFLQQKHFHQLKGVLLLFSCLLFTFCSIKVFSGEPLSPFKFQRYTVNDGLSQGTILSMHQDKKGFIWLGTENGLNRFDGYEFVQFKSIKGHDIRAITESSEGDLWVGTTDALNVLRSNKEEFETVKMAAATSIKGKNIQALTFDESGILWIGTAQGLFKKIPYPDINLALHVSAQTQSGTVHITPGFAMANVDSVDVTFYGEGGHGAYPHLTKDPIVMSSQFITTVQTIISRNLSPINAGVVTVGSIHGGTKHNIIPNHVDLQITVRSYSDEDRELIISRIKKIAESIAIQNDLPKNLYPIVKLRDEYTPAVFNNPDLAMRAKEILSKELGKDKVFDGPQVMGGEDFGQFGRVEPKIPSLLFWIGAVSQKDYKEFLNNSKKLPSLHSSKFLPDYEKTIDTGISSSIALIEAHLK